jgi:hypothetical protein
MSQLFYGSSNVYRNYTRFVSAGGLGPEVELIECTKKAVFDAHLQSVGQLAPGSLLLTSVLENFISDACRDLEEAEIDLFANQQISAHVETLADLLQGSPDSFGAISPPIQRIVPGMF